MTAGMNPDTGRCLVCNDYARDCSCDEDFDEMTPIEQVAAAIAEHGSPNWVAYVPMSIVKQVPYDTLVELLKSARKVRTDDKHRAILNHLMNHIGETITTNDIAGIMQVSLPTARNFIADHPRHLSKDGKGRWLIRDAKGN